MTRRSTGSGSFSAEAADPSKISVDFGGTESPVPADEPRTLEVNVTNSQNLLSTLDEDFCQVGQKNAYDLEVYLYIESAPTDASTIESGLLSSFRTQQQLDPGGGGSEDDTGSGGSDDVIQDTARLCVPAFGGQRTATFTFPPQQESGRIIGRVEVVGFGSKTLVAEETYVINVDPVSDGSGGTDGGDTGGTGGGGGGGDAGGDDGGRRGSGTPDPDAPDGQQSLGAFWASRSQAEKAAIVLGGGGLLVALAGRE